MSIQDPMVHFYADDGTVASTQPERLQRVVDVLADLFDRIILCKNICKTVSMAFQPIHMPISMSVVAYE